MISTFCFLLQSVASVYGWIIIIAILLTFVQPNRYNPAVQFIYRATEPLFAYTRKYLPFLVFSGIDFSPIVILFVLQYIPIAICSLF